MHMCLRLCMIFAAQLPLLLLICCRHDTAVRARDWGMLHARRAQVHREG